MALIQSFKKKKNSIEFVGRESYIQTFHKALKEIEKKEFLVLNYYGIGGIGKSTMQKQMIHSIENDEDKIYIEYNFDDDVSVKKVYESIVTQLSKKVNLLYFSLAYTIYWSKINPNVDLKDSNLSFLEEGSFLGDALSLIDGLSGIGLAGGILGIINKNYKNIVQKLMLDSDKAQELSELGDKSIHQIEQELSIFLAYDLKKHLSKNPNNKFVFFFDTYERLWESSKKESMRLGVDEWVRDMVISLADVRALFVIMGREELLWTQKDKEWSDYIWANSVSGLSQDESKTLLINSGIKELDIVDMIASSSEGVPFYLSLAIDTYNDLQEPTLEHFNITAQDEIFERFIRYLDRYELPLLEILSITRFFTNELYNSLCKEFNLPLSSTIFNSILHFSFIKTQGEKHFMHNLMKKSMRERLQKPFILEVENFLFDYYDKLIKLDASYANEALYYCMRVKDIDFAKNWFDEVVSAFNSDGNFISLIPLYDTFIDMIDDENDKIRYKILLADTYLKVEDLNKASNILKELSSTSLSADLVDDFYYLQASFSELSNNHEEAKIYYERALSQTLDEDIKINSLIALGNYYRKQKDYQRALSLLNNTIDLVKNNSKYDLLKAEVFQKLGFVYYNKKDYQRSYDYFVYSLELKSSLLKPTHINIAKSYRALAMATFFLKRYEDAQEYIQKTIDIFSNIFGLHNGNTKSAYELFAKNLVKNHKDAYAIEFDIDRFSPSFTYHFLSKVYLSKKEYKISDYFLEKSIASTKDEQELLQIYILIIRMYKSFQMYDKSREYLEKKYKIYQKNGDLKNLAKICGYLALFHSSSKEYELAQRYYIQQCEVLESSDDIKALASAYGYLGNFYKSRKNMSESEVYFIKQCQVLENTHFYVELDNSYKIIAAFYRSLGDMKKVLSYLQKRIELWEKKDNIDELFTTYNDIYMLYSSKKDMANSLSVLEKMQTIFDGNKLDIIYGKMIELYEAQKDFLKAEEFYLKQISLRKLQKNPIKLSKGYGFLAKFYKRSNRLDEAEKNLIKSIEVLYDLNDPKKIADGYKYLIYFYEDTDNDEKLYKALKEQLKYREDSGIELDIALSYKDLSIYFNKKNDPKNEEKYLLLWQYIIEKKRDRYKKASLYHAMARFYEKTSQVENAAFYFKKNLLVIALEGSEKHIDQAYRRMYVYYKENGILDQIENILKAEIGSLISQKEYKKSAVFIGFLDEYYYEKNSKTILYKYLDTQCKKIKKEPKDEQRKTYKKIFTQLQQNGKNILSSYFLDKYLTLLDEEYKQKEYKNALSFFKRYKRWQYFNKYKNKLKTLTA